MMPAIISKSLITVRPDQLPLLVMTQQPEQMILCLRQAKVPVKKPQPRLTISLLLKNPRASPQVLSQKPGANWKNSTTLTCNGFAFQKTTCGLLPALPAGMNPASVFNGTGRC